MTGKEILEVIEKADSTLPQWLKIIAGKLFVKATDEGREWEQTYFSSLLSKSNSETPVVKIKKFRPVLLPAQFKGHETVTLNYTATYLIPLPNGTTGMFRIDLVEKEEDLGWKTWPNNTR